MYSAEIPNIVSKGLSLLIQNAGFEKKQHQFDCVEWGLKNELTHNIGGLIADEMGLGKTTQMIGIIQCNPKPLSLIVLPLALLHQWKEAIHLMTGKVPIVYHGPAKKRIQLSELANSEESKIVLTTYGSVMLRKGKAQSLHDVKWDRICFDEAHHLRNPKTSVTKGALTLQSNLRWLITGTPIQNRKRDFYSLCEVMGIPPHVYKKQENLINIVKTMICRRTKESVGMKLPALTQSLHEVDWSSDSEADLAEQIHSTLQFSQLKPRASKLTASLGESILPLLTRARQCCVFPGMLLPHIKKLQESGMVDVDVKLDAGMKGASKLDQVCDKIKSRKDNGKRKIVFCHYHAEIDYIAERCKNYGIDVSVYDGRMGYESRKQTLQSDCDILILQIQSGCEGLNLQNFSEVYFVSPHWNPAVEDQAIARCHRMGQTKPVEVFRFHMAGFDIAGASKRSRSEFTIDQYSAHKQDIKREIAKDVLDCSK